MMVLIFLLSSLPIGVFGANFIEENIRLYIISTSDYKLYQHQIIYYIHHFNSHTNTHPPLLLSWLGDWLAVFGWGGAGGRQLVLGCVEGEQF